MRPYVGLALFPVPKPTANLHHKICPSQHSPPTTHPPILHLKPHKKDSHRLPHHNSNLGLPFTTTTDHTTHKPTGTSSRMERQRRRRQPQPAQQPSSRPLLLLTTLLLGLCTTSQARAAATPPPATCRHTPSSSPPPLVGVRGGSDGVREVLRGEGLLATVKKAIQRQGAWLNLAPVLFVGARDEPSRALLGELFDFVKPPTGAATQVTVAPFGDVGAAEDEGDEERQALAVVTALAAEEADLTSGGFASAARDVAVSLALASDVVWSVAFSDVLRGELRGGLPLLQAALEQYLHFQDKGLVDPEAPAKTLHLVVSGVGDEEAEELGLGAALEAHVTQLWKKLIKPAGAEDEEEGDEEEVAGVPNLSTPAWARVLTLNLVFVPSKVYAASQHNRVLGGLKASLDQKLAQHGPFLPGPALEVSISALLPVSKEFVAGPKSLPKEDTVVSTFYLDKLVGRYTAQFRMDSRQLMEELNTGYDEDFGKTFSELIDKYLADFHQEVYGTDAGPIHTSLQGLDAGAVAAVVRHKKEQLRKSLLGVAEEGYTRQLQFLKQMAQEEFRKGISALKYQWELIPGFTKAIKAAKALFVDRAAKLACARGGPRWKATAENELRSLSKVLENQADDVIERTRAGGGFVPTKLRRPIGIQFNWLGANFFHFLRDSSVDPLSIRTDSGVALWQNLGETWVSRDGKDQRVSARYRSVYGQDIDPVVLDYLLTSPKGVGLNDKDPRMKFGWNRRLAYELIRNHDDMTFQVPHAKAIASY